MIPESRSIPRSQPIPESVEPAVLPFVRKCLDRQRVCDVLNRLIAWPAGREPTSIRIHRFTPRPELAFDFEYSVTLGQETDSHRQHVRLYGRCPRLPNTTESRCASATVTRQGVGNVLIDCPELNLTIHSMDKDATFPFYSQCMTGSDMARTLAQLHMQSDREQDVDEGMDIACNIVSFRRGRRFVVRYQQNCASNGIRAYAGKCYAGSRGRRLCRQHNAVAVHLASLGSSDVEIPKLLGYDPDLHMVITEWDSSEWDSSETHDDDRPSASLVAQRAAKVLISLQSIPLDLVKTSTPDRYWKTLENWNNCIDWLIPSMSHLATPLLQNLSACRANLPAEPQVVTHGDFYDPQCVVRPEATTILDLDTLASGDRSLDMGNWLAHQYLTCLQSSQNRDTFASLVHDILDTFEMHTYPLNQASLVYYWSATLFRIGSIHAFRDKTSHYTLPLWSLAADLLQHGIQVLNGFGDVRPVQHRHPASDRSCVCTQKDET